MLPSIILTKNGVVIMPYEKGQCQAIENFTSHYDAVYRKRIEDSGFFIPKFKDNVGAFLTHSQSKEALARMFPQYVQIQKKVIVPYVTEDFSLIDEIKLKPLQEEAVSTILNTRGYDEWFINLQTAQGKTLTAVYLSSVFRVKTLIVCYLTDVLGQWINTYTEKTTIHPERVLLLSSAASIAKLIDGELDADDYDIFLATPNLLTSFAKRNGYLELERFAKTVGIGLVIYDEAHRNMGAIIKINAVCNFKYTLYLSADYAQADEKREQKYYRMFHRTLIYKPSKEEEKSFKYTDVIVVEYDTHPTQKDALSIRNRYGYNAQNYMEYQVRNGKIFRVAKFIVDMILTTGEFVKYKALILMTNVEHVNQMKDYLAELYKGQLIVGRYHGSMSYEEKQGTIECADIIVATYLSFGTGKDEQKIKYVIGLNQSNKIEDNQAAGRARPLPDGSHVKYLMTVDVGFKYCRDKLKTRLQYLRETKMSEDAANRIWYDDPEELHRQS